MLEVQHWHESPCEETQLDNQADFFPLFTLTRQRKVHEERDKLFIVPSWSGSILTFLRSWRPPWGRDKGTASAGLCPL